jgi:predicted ArsR family transcriptional regulator
MTPLWRYLTKAAGMTAQMLADAAGMTIQQARADLAELEGQGKACRERGGVGKPHLWWRAGSRPLDSLDVLLHMALAAHYHPSPDRLREILASSGNRARDKATQKIVLMCAQSKAPHQIVWQALKHYLPEEQAQEAA